MQTRLKELLVLIVVGAMIAACGSRDGSGEADASDGTDGSTGTSGTAGGDGVDGTDGSTGSTDGSSQETTIQSLQTGDASAKCAEGGNFTPLSKVTIKDAVIIGERWKYKKKDQENAMFGYYIAQGSGENSGIKVYYYENEEVASSQVHDLKSGDKVTLVGDYGEHYCMSQIKISSGTKSGSEPAPAPSTPEPAKLSHDSTPEAWESCYVALENVEVTTVRDYDFIVTGGVIVASNTFWSKPDFEIEVGTKLTKIAGFIEFSFGEYRLTATEIAGEGGPGKPPGPAEAKTIEEIQKASESCDSPKDVKTTQQGVEITGTVVSPVQIVGQKKSLNGVFITNDTGGPWSGTFMTYDVSLKLVGADKLTVGSVVKATGEVQEAFCSTSFKAASIEVTGTTDQLTPQEVLVDDLVGADAEQYEGVYVTLKDLEVSDVTNAGMPGSDCPSGAKCYGEFTVKGGLLIRLVDYNINFTPTVGSKISQVTGAVHYHFENYKVEVFSDADITAGQ